MPARASLTSIGYTFVSALCAEPNLKAQVQRSPMSNFEIGKYKKCGVGRGGVWSGSRKRFPLFWKGSYNIRVCAWSCHVMCMCLPGPSKYNNKVGAENHSGQAQSILTGNIMLPWGNDYSDRPLQCWKWNIVFKMIASAGPFKVAM